MKAEKKLIPKVKFGISYFIKEQLSVLNLTNESLLQKLAVSKKEYDESIESKEIITKEFASKLSNVFSTSTQYWINIDTNYKKWLNN